MKLIKSILKHTFTILSLVLLLTSCKNHKIIGEYHGNHYIYQSNLGQSTTNLEKISISTDPNGVITGKDTTRMHVIAEKKLLEQQINHVLFIDKELNITTTITIIDNNRSFKQRKYIYHGTAEVIDNVIKVNYWKKVEQEFNIELSTYVYKNPLTIAYSITKDNNEIDCILYYNNSNNNDKFNGIDKDIWTYQYWLHSPKEIRKRQRKPWK